MKDPKYVIQADGSSFCEKCHKSVELLCREDGGITDTWFYICFDCRKVYELGRGEVKKA